VKLIVAIVHSEDAGALVSALLDKEFRATRLQSSGGFLKQSNATIILGVEDADVDEVMSIVRTNCTSRSASIFSSGLPPTAIRSAARPALIGPRVPSVSAHW